MKRSLFIIFCLLICILAGCASDDTPYVPTGDGLTWDEASPDDTIDPNDVPEQELVLVYYPNKTMNPFTCTDFTNKALFSLIYQSLFVVDADYETVD